MLRHLSTSLSLLGLFAIGSSVLVACGDSGTTGGGGAGAGEEGGGGGETDGGGGGGLSGEPVKILNWNLHNFYDTVEDANSEGDDSFSQSEYDDKLAAAVDILAELDPDVLILQEVENESILEDLNDALDGVYTEQSLLPGNDPRGVDLAALSKIQFDDVVSHLDETFLLEGTNGPEYRFTRDLVEYHFEVNGQKVVLLNVHFKAKGDSDDPDRRLAEAQRARAVADELVEEDSSRAVMVLGDYNDLPTSNPVEAVLGSNPTFSSAADNVEEDDRWTFNFMGALELIDHQIGNPTMMDRLDPESVVIRHGSDAEAASDHAPLMGTYYFE